MPHPTNNILIPIDFSEQSFRAVKYAAVVAQSISVRLNFLYVFEVGETSPAFRTKQHQTAMNQVHKKFKSSIITLLENLGNINQELFIEQGKVYDRIL
ncbi:MAG: universal stress protein, partial [Bacteroidota bacterium]